MATRTVKFRPTRLGAGYGEAEAAGVGVDPGAGDGKYPGPKIGNPLSQLKEGFAGLQRHFEKGRVEKSAREDEMYRRKGELAHWSAQERIARNRTMRRGGG